MSSDASPTVGTLGERALIARLREQAGAPPAWIHIGIGDDAAVVEPRRGMLEVVTTDCLIEDVHFRRAWASAADIGYKALAVNLSDLAAMGATPRASFLSLGLPADLPVDDFDGLVRGFVDLAGAAGAPLVGGNLARSPGPLIVDVTVTGAGHRRKLLRRSAGRAGDALVVTGQLGAAAAGLRMLADEAGEARTPAEGQCITRHLRPEPRLRQGMGVGRAGVPAACMDLSDGLADAARQIAEASGTGVVIEAERLPIHEGAATWARRRGHDARRLALAGGEDYELLFAVAPKHRRRLLAAAGRAPGVPLTLVGHLMADPGCWLEEGGERQPLPAGFAHFGRILT